MLSNKPPKKQTASEVLVEIEKMNREARRKEAIWKRWRERRELELNIERGLLVLIGFVIGALAMYASFPK